MTEFFLPRPFLGKKSHLVPPFLNPTVARRPSKTIQGSEIGFAGLERNDASRTGTARNPGDRHDKNGWTTVAGRREIARRVRMRSFHGPRTTTRRFALPSVLPVDNKFLEASLIENLGLHQPTRLPDLAAQTLIPHKSGHVVDVPLGSKDVCRDLPPVPLGQRIPMAERGLGARHSLRPLSNFSKGHLWRAVRREGGVKERQSGPHVGTP